jgi:transcriptional regulator with XRE-family HTH domain
MNLDPTHLPKRCRQLRTELGISQYECDERFKITSTTWGKYERGLMYPTLAVLIRIANIVGKSLDWFVSEDEK